MESAATDVRLQQAMGFTGMFQREGQRRQSDLWKPLCDSRRNFRIPVLRNHDNVCPFLVKDLKGQLVYLRRYGRRKVTSRCQRQRDRQQRIGFSVTGS